MSDLISRSELIEKLWQKHKEVEDKCYGYTDTDEVKEIICGIVSMIDEHPTAYDRDKVVEELEQNKRKLFSFTKDYDEVGDFAMAEIYSQRASEYITAIEIVKQGGVSDDVCEWKIEDEEANLYVARCGQRQLIFEGTPKENGYRFCPYCGKKIKAVE